MSEPLHPLSDDMPDFVRWLAETFYRVVNATAQYVATYAFVALAAILTQSIFLVGLKYALLFAFVARALYIMNGGPRYESLGCWSLAARSVLATALVFPATFAGNAAVEAGLVQLDDDQSSKAVERERLRQVFRRAGINLGCYDADYAEISPACQKLQAEQVDAEMKINARQAPQQPPVARNP